MLKKTNSLLKKDIARNQRNLYKALLCIENMQTSTKRVLILGLFSILITGLIGFVSAQTSATTIKDDAITIITNMFNGESTSYVKDILSPQILFGILIFLVIFAIISKISLFGGSGVKTITSVVIAILAAGFIDVQWIYPLLNQYTAMGITITLLLPFALIFYFIKEVAPHNRLIHHIVWGTFAVIVFVNASMNWAAIPDGQQKLSQFLYFLLMLASVFMFIFGNKIYDYMFKEELKDAIDQYKDANKVQIEAAINKLEESKTYLTVGSSGYDKKMKDIDKKIKGLKSILK